MLIPDEATLTAKASLATAVSEGTLSPEEGLQKIFELDPLDPMNLLGLAVLRRQQGKLDEAAQFLWRSAEANPCRWDPYLALASLEADAAHLSPASSGLLALGFRKALADEKRFRQEARDLGLGKGFGREEMEGFVAHSGNLQATEPQSVTDLLRPHRLVHELHYPLYSGVRPEVVEQILEYRDRCRPLLLGTLRGWLMGSFDDEYDFPAEAALALLGEMGDLTTLPALLDFVDEDRDDVREAACWAICRLSELHPGEVLPLLRQAAANASPYLRWGLAQVYSMMPGVDGVEKALLDLLPGLENVEEQDREALFCAVAWGLQASQGRPARALVLALIAQYSQVLSPPAQAESLLPVEDNPSPPPQLSVYDFCCEPLEDEDEEEEEAPAVRPKLGRNDPCWCGSGKKYKKCHLSADEAGEQIPFTDDASLLQQVLTFLEQELRPNETKEGVKTFLGDVKEIDEDDEASLVDWLVHDYRVPRFGRTVYEEFLARHRDRLTPELSHLAETHARSTFRLLEVQDVKPGSGIQVRDLLQGGEFFAHDVSASRTVSRWDPMLCRVLDLDARKELTGAYLLLPRAICGRFRDWALADHQEKGLDWPAYLRANGHRLRRQALALHRESQKSTSLATVEGDPLVFSKAVYQVLDEQALRIAAEQSPFLDSTDDSGDLTWFETPAASIDEPRRALGHLRFQGDRLILECTSRERLKRGRALLASVAPEALKHLGDEFTDWRQAMRQAQSKPPAAPAEPLPPEVERKLLEDFYTRHYARWPDTPLPALSGRTPRQAVSTPDGREKVIALLKDFENDNERARREGRYVYDFSAIQAELGIDSL